MKKDKLIEITVKLEMIDEMILENSWELDRDTLAYSQLERCSDIVNEILLILKDDASLENVQNRLIDLSKLILKIQNIEDSIDDLDIIEEYLSQILKYF